MPLDASAAALAVARANGAAPGPGRRLAGQRLVVGAAADRRFDLALTNPPYIAAGDPHLPALRHEPSRALTPGGDGLAALAAIIAGAAGHLQPGGWLLLEHGFDQADAVRRLLAAAGFERVATRRDLAGHERCSGGRRPPRRCAVR